MGKHTDMSDAARLQRIKGYVSENGEAPPPGERHIEGEPCDGWDDGGEHFDDDDSTEHWVDMLIRLASLGIDVKL